MIEDILTGLGIVAIVEGLVLALAPLRLEDLLRFLSEMETEQKRLIGLGAVTLGTIIVWVARL